MYETAQQAWDRIATRMRSHPLEKIGRKVFGELSEKQWIEILASICKNNIEHGGRVPDITSPTKAIVQDECEIFPTIMIVVVDSGGKLIIEPIKGGFVCKWVP